MKHFAKIVPLKVQNKLKTLADLILDEYIQDVNSEANGCNRLDEISGVAYDGFIPLQDGGFEISEFYSNGSCSGSFISEKEEKHVEKMQEGAYNDFLEDKNLPKGTELTDEQYEEFLEYEDEYLTPSLLRAELWADDFDSEEPKIFCRLSLGYTDAPYYRAKYDERIKEIELSVKQFLKEKNEKIAKTLFKKLSPFKL